MECANWLARLVVILSVAVGASGGLAEEKVAELGDRRLIEVQGAELFETDTLVPYLFSDLAVVRASHPAAPLAEYEAAIRKSALRHLNHQGFPDATLDVHFHRAENRVVVELDEGLHYTCGKVNVVGAKQCDPDLIVRRLTEYGPGADATRAKFVEQHGQTGLRWADHRGKNVDAQSPAWRAGKSPHWDEHARENLVKSAQNALVDAGYREARCEVALEQDPARCEAMLVVNIVNEGSPTVVRELLIEGNKKNTREELIEYLDLKTGVPLTRDELTRIQRKLWEAARFIKYDVGPVEPIVDQAAALRVEVKEYAEAPELNEPLRPAEAAALKCRQWLVEFGQRREDLVATFGDESMAVSVIISPEHGWLIEHREVVDKVPQRAPIRSLYLGDDVLTITEWEARQKLSVPLNSTVQITSTIDLEPVLDGKDSLSLKSGLGWKFTSEPHDLFDLKLSMEPIVFLSFAHEKEAKCEFEGNILDIRQSNGTHLRIDSTTGQLLVCENLEDGFYWRLQFQAGAYLLKRGELDRQASRFANMYSPERPVSTLLAFLCEDSYVRDILNNVAKNPKAAAAVQKLIDGRVLQPLDDMLLKRRTSLADFLVHDFDSPGKGGLSAMGWRSLLSFNDELFARHTWPWSICRETASLLLGDPRYLTAEANAIVQSKDTGPMGMCILATCIRPFSARAANQAALQGALHLSDEAFHHECDVLLTRPSLARDLVLQFAGVLKSMTDEEVQALGGFLSPAAAERLLAASRNLREHSDKTPKEAVQLALDEVWRERWRAIVIERLTEFAKKPEEKKSR